MSPRTVKFRTPVTVGVILLLALSTASVNARPKRSCHLFADSVQACLELEDLDYERSLRRFCESLYEDTRMIMRPDPRRKDLRHIIRDISCEAIKARGAFAALDDAITAFSEANELSRHFEEEAAPAKRRRWQAIQDRRLEEVSFSELEDCPVYDGHVPQTRVCRYHTATAPIDTRPDVVLVLSGGMVTGMNFLQHPANIVIDALAKRFDVWAFVAEAAPMHSFEIADLRWQISNLARNFVEDHPGARVVLMGFSNGAAQVFHAINRILPRNRFAAARPVLSIFLDMVDAAPFVVRTLTMIPDISEVISFRGAHSRPSPPRHGAHRLRCLDQTACTEHVVRTPDGVPAAHIDVPELVVNNPEHRVLLIEALNDALP